MEEQLMKEGSITLEQYNGHLILMFSSVTERDKFEGLLALHVADDTNRNEADVFEHINMTMRYRYQHRNGVVSYVLHMHIDGCEVANDIGSCAHEDVEWVVKHNISSLIGNTGIDLGANFVDTLGDGAVQAMLVTGWTFNDGKLASYGGMVEPRAVRTVTI